MAGVSEFNNHQLKELMSNYGTVDLYGLMVTGNGARHSGRCRNSGISAYPESERCIEFENAGLWRL